MNARTALTTAVPTAEAEVANTGQAAADAEDAAVDGVDVASAAQAAEGDDDDEAEELELDKLEFVDISEERGDEQPIILMVEIRLVGAVLGSSSSDPSS